MGKCSASPAHPFIRLLKTNNNKKKRPVSRGLLSVAKPRQVLPRQRSRRPSYFRISTPEPLACARPPCKVIDFDAGHLCSGSGVVSRPVNQSLVCVISCHAIVRWLSQQIRYIVSLNVSSSTRLELGYKTVCASGTELLAISSLQNIILY